MFIKLTVLNDKKIWLNVLKMGLITDEDTHTNIYLGSDAQFPVQVKESPKQIVEMIGEMKNETQ